MEKLHKYNSFNTNTPLSESYKNEACLSLYSLVRNIYEGRLQSSWSHFITPNLNFVEVR
jgi:hypothetical protein